MADLPLLRGFGGGRNWLDPASTQAENRSYRTQCGAERMANWEISIKLEFAEHIRSFPILNEEDDHVA